MSNANNMSALDIARRLAELGQAQESVKAYTLALGTAQGQDSETELECALNILQMGGNYLVAYDTLRDLYARGEFAEDCLSVMTQAFYAPNEKLLKSRYEKNCKLLQKYPYLFRKDFPSFEELPLRFYPYDDNRYLPFDGQFGALIEPKETVISRNFFRDLSKPILASDVFSMYELEYLNDNVRKSEWVGYENHIYLHYTDWTIFCSYLQILNLREILKDEKIVYLIENEVEQYPINFKERFGVDYSTYSLKPVAIQEYNRLIWHTQLSTHNGGDFFNEILDSHPNLVVIHSLFLTEIEDFLGEMRKHLSKEELARFTEKDLLVAAFLHLQHATNASHTTDSSARIVPAIFFQPHFPNLYYDIAWESDRNRAIMECIQHQDIVNFPAFKHFKYIKTFTPMRRPTTSVGATARFMSNTNINKGNMVTDFITERLLNQSHMVDRDERLFKDSIIVRFEDGKLNPKATFTALAAFLDLPYTESMTYCSLEGVRNAASFEGNDIGFDTAAVYRTYDEYLGEPEKYFIEFFLRDTYKYYGYDFQHYDGNPIDLERAKELCQHFDVFKNIIRRNLDDLKVNGSMEHAGIFANDDKSSTLFEQLLQDRLNELEHKRLAVVSILLRDMQFINRSGRPLKFTPLLQLDPELLENPLYR